MAPRILAIESSCDETAAAVVEGSHVLASVVRSQIEIHARFGGVVPELASRHHLGGVVPVVDEAVQRSGCSLAELDAIAVTEGPGLVGALLVGVQMASGLATALGVPLIGVHHMEGHLLSAFLGDDERPARPLRAHVALLVSGGHTELCDVAGLGQYRILGATRDDAAGEAYDKVAKLLGLGYPGGPVIDGLAAEGDPTAIAFPRAMADRSTLELSFSGLKTAVRVYVDRHGQPGSRQALADLCASFQAAVIDVLMLKAQAALRQTGRDRLHIVGGVAANRGLRAAAERAAREHGFSFEAVPLRYCGDNAAMIGAAAAARLEAGLVQGVHVHTSLALDDPRVLAS
ncbi:tRNA (adenosine(37)-N6)-threonylcarbamoyltransferase complex transferase subunit TsaD [Paraliomyxa miuraensis]|uniref:tRNA (adenosine(37)-N6)-threonylcarbamoyltransferase complex transferase subunit TsaD n=1 Tax=Paraliomyxa miuraensis TaxID=376150 RepID=UPI0022556B98|nr:tRNA (adenosine(37)-N6)-threonylcarbamoyltransferase complex transferase subunit TsaD [Paraliomyxa miuraensis]MCX4244062.1 tRNA (adenosine(37)-N6)-threonylcarbamoyltransferase complex transferase subunit TsaD [Paraliomyxa miuraensis]